MDFTWSEEQRAYREVVAEFGRRELEFRSNQLAHVLNDLGVARGDRVGLYLDESLESLVGI